MFEQRIKFIILIYMLCDFFLNNGIGIFHHYRNLILKESQISVIIPLYNGGIYLNNSLRSVQNQKFKDIEIIIIDDNSSDDSLKIIQRYIKKDNRIKLIINKENRRILFCKSFGALNSKGKYIIEVDQDDQMLNDEALDILYNESEELQLDLLHFKYFYGHNITTPPKINIPDKNRIIESQPKLKFNQFKKHIYLLWGNLIKSDLYKKVIYNLWPIIINYKIIFQEDFLITFFILIYAQKSKAIKNKFYHHFANKRQISNGYLNNPEFYLSIIFAGIIFYDYYIISFPQDFPIILNYIKFEKKLLKKAKTLHPSIFNYFFGKILSNARLFNLNKTKIMKIFNITKNCDSYKYLIKKKLNLFRDFSTNKIIFKRKEKEFYELSIIIIFLNFKSIIKIINNIIKQNFESFEIIIIYDGEKKEKFNFINNYLKAFPFIKLINNEIKRGIFYSISKGVMYAKGNYLMILNPNSFFLNKNVFHNIINEIRMDNIDILEFNLYKILPNNYINLYTCKHYISKFNLTQIKYNLEYNNLDINNELL